MSTDSKRVRITPPLIALGLFALLALVGFALTLFARAVSPERAPFAYLAAFVFALSTALGALTFAMIAETARATWFVIFRNIAESIASTIPLFLLLFIPIALSLPALYGWARIDSAGTTIDPQMVKWIGHQRAWNNPPFFIGRSYAYLVIWSLLAVAARRASRRASALGGSGLRTLSAAGLPIMATTITLAAFDWIMPLNAGWYSDILGLYAFAGAFAGAVGVITVVAHKVVRAGLFPNEVGASHFHALGRVLLVAVMFWAYMGISQFLLMWIADLPREIAFYAARVGNGWTLVTALLFASHFAVPFLLLLSRGIKHRSGVLALVAGWLVLAHALDVVWLIVPALGAPPSLLDGAPILGVTSLCIAAGLVHFRAAAPFPDRDPELARSLRYESS